MKRGLTDSFNYAINGFIHAIRTQRNMRIHVIFAIIVIIASLIFKINRVEVLVLVISITLVISTELLNTAIESAVDATTNYYHPLVRVAKNTAAAAVLVTAVNAVVVGILIFWTPITQMTVVGVSLIKSTSPYFAFAVLGIVTFIVLYLKAHIGEGTPLRGGMPSGHTAIAFAMATMMSYITVNPIVVTLSFILALIVAQSRIDTRVHTFWEVFAGALIGFSVTVIMFRLFGF
ncbi:MAG: diacylglycerol kinase [Clostridiaceae bacterium]